MKKTFTLLALLAVGVAHAQIPTDGLYAFYPFNGDANDAVGSLHGSPSFTTLTADRAGNPNSAYNFNGTSSLISLGTSTDWRLNQYNGMTISAWVRTQADFNASLGTIFSRWTGSTNLDDYALFLTQFNGRPLVAVNAPSNAGVGPNTGVAANQWQHVVFSFSKLTNRHVIYLNGAEVYNQVVNGTLINPGANIAVYIGAQGTTTNGYTRTFKGDIDDVRVYTRDLSGTEVSQLYQAELGQAPCAAVGVSQHPQSASICEGLSSSTLSVAVDDPTASVQWQFNSGGGWNDMTGETGLTVEAATGGLYRAKVTADCGTVSFSNEATITNGGPSFVTPFTTPSFICPNIGSLTLTADAIGEGLTYQWRTGVVGQVSTYQEDVPGANSASFNITTPNLLYTVVISACGQSVTSNFVEVLPGLMPGVNILGNEPSQICAGQQLFLFTQVMQTSTFYWDPTGETSGQIYASPTENSVYTVYATNTQGCTATASRTINVIDVEEPVITQLGADLTVQNTYTSYSWWIDYPETGLSEIGAYTPTYAPVMDGSYVVVVTANVGSNAGVCTFTSAPFNYTGTVTGISQAAPEAFTVFPNPFSNEMTVEAKSTTVLTLHNVLGMEVWSRTVSGRTVISTETLPAGVYFLRDAATASVVRVVRR